LSGTYKMGHRSAAAAILIGTSLTGLPATVFAADGAGAPASALAEKPDYNLEAGLAVSAAMGRGAWVFGGFEFGVRVLERLSLTAVFDASFAHDPMEADCGDVYCPDSEYKVGARARLHVLPSFVIDPWAGLGGVARIDTGKLGTKGGFDAQVSLGADVRLGHVAFGPFGFLNEPLSRSDWPSGWQGQLGLGFRGAMNF
jgi:hypothetical protein